MNWIDFAGTNFVADLGWTIVHSIWQVAMLAALLFLVLKIADSFSPGARYVIAATTMLIAALVPILTFVDISTDRNGTDSVARSERLFMSEAPSSTATSGVDSKKTSNATSTAIAAPASVSVEAVRSELTKRLAALLPFAVGLWLIGVAFFALRLAGGMWQLRRYRRDGAGLDSEWNEKVTGLIARLGIRRTIGVLRSGVAATPIAIGIFRPMILIPAAAFLQISPRELETVIAHELIHIRRLDPVINAFQNVVETILFYHPAIWWISSVIRREREFSADAAVLDLFTDSRVDYARALANLEALRQGADQNTPHLAAALNGGNLMERIERILKIKTEARTHQSAWIAGMALMLTSALLTALFLSNSGELVNAQTRTGAKKLAIGFVSIPPVDRTANAPKDADATMRLLIDTLKRHKVPAIGFLQGGMISDGEKFFPVRKEIARMWIDAGFELGLGGYKHIWLHNTPVDEYIANIEKNEAIAKKLLGDMGAPPRYFSYPYLNTGKSVDDKAKVEAWLAAPNRGYTSVKYTVDNQEWMYSYAYDMARNDNDVNTMREIRTSYLAYIAKMFDHYEAYSQEMFGRDIAQTMVLTPSRLITDTADEFFLMASKRGYSFVSVDEAQGDEAYKTPENFTGSAGISWFERWGMEKKMKLRNEPPVDASIERTWKAKSNK